MTPTMTGYTRAYACIMPYMLTMSHIGHDVSGTVVHLICIYMTLYTYALFYKNDTFSLHSAARTYYGQVDAPSDSSPLAPQAVDLAALLAYTIHQDQVWEPLLIESPKEFLKTLKDTLHWPSNE